MGKRSLFYASGIGAVALYVLLLLWLGWMVRENLRVKRYALPQSPSVEVTIMGPENRPPAEGKERPTPTPKRPEPTSAPAPAPTPSPTPEAKKPSKEAPKPSEAERTRIKEKPKENDKQAGGASSLVKSLNLQRHNVQMELASSASGEVNAYFTKVAEIISRAWQPDAKDAGQLAEVRLRIAPDGRFEYTLSRPSAQAAFNQRLDATLKILSQTPLPPPPEGKTLVIQFNFKAKDS